MTINTKVRRSSSGEDIYECPGANRKGKKNQQDQRPKNAFLVSQERLDSERRAEGV